jgi:hypothetical protein
MTTILYVIDKSRNLKEALKITLLRIPAKLTTKVKTTWKYSHKIVGFFTNLKRAPLIL